MQIQLNGEPQTLERAMTVQALLEQLELINQRLAVEINEDLVPRSQFAEHQIQDGDQIEIVRAIGGG